MRRLLIVAAVLLVLGACSSSEKAASPTNTTASPAAGPAGGGPSSEEAEALSRQYLDLKMNRDYAAARPLMGSALQARYDADNTGFTGTSSPSFSGYTITSTTPADSKWTIVANISEKLQGTPTGTFDDTLTVGLEGGALKVLDEQPGCC